MTNKIITATISDYLFKTTIDIDSVVLNISIVHYRIHPTLCFYLRCTLPFFYFKIYDITQKQSIVHSLLKYLINLKYNKIFQYALRMENSTMYVCLYIFKRSSVLSSE